MKFIHKWIGRNSGPLLQKSKKITWVKILKSREYFGGKCTNCSSAIDSWYLVYNSDQPMIAFRYFVCDLWLADLKWYSTLNIQYLRWAIIIFRFNISTFHQVQCSILWYTWIHGQLIGKSLRYNQIINYQTVFELWNHFLYIGKSLLYWKKLR